jgi:acetylornithine/succinyldiaminopimelate/putrescine aminotransferase
VFDPAGGMSAVHASTFFGNEIAATVAGRVVGRCLDKRFQKHVARVGQQLGTGLQAIMNEHSHVVVGVRGRGMLYGVEVIDPVLRDPLIRGCARRGLICQPSGHDATVLVMPPLVISGGEVDEGLGWFEQAVARL